MNDELKYIAPPPAVAYLFPVRSMPRKDLPFCNRHWLERAAHGPDNPVQFDPELNEYNLKAPGGPSLRIYHCPFCAGRAPEFLRAQNWATVPAEESDSAAEFDEGH